MASNKATKKIEFPLTINDRIAELARDARAIQSEIIKIQEQVRKLAAKEFIAAGGCDTCKGRGWVVVWDTSDSLSGCYAEYGTCPNPDCTHESRTRTGLDLSRCNTKYDTIRGTFCDIQKHPAFVSAAGALIKLRDELNGKVNYLNTQVTLFKGTKVVIKRGREGVGEVGVVAFVKATSWGDKVLVKKEAEWQDRTAGGIWAYAKNVEALWSNEG